MPIRLTPAVKSLIIVCFITFLIQQTGDQFFGTHFLNWFALIPFTFFKNHRVWQLVTYPFLHSDVMHLFFNLLMLAFIGSELEMSWGRRRFLTYFFVCSMSAGVFYLLLELALGGASSYAPMIGISAAIYGLLVAYGIFFGERTLVFMMLFPMKAKHFVAILALIELMTSIYSRGGGVSSIAHLGGMAAGFFYLWAKANWMIARRSIGKNLNVASRKRKRLNKHLKLIVNNQWDVDNQDDDDQDHPKTWQ